MKNKIERNKYIIFLIFLFLYGNYFQNTNYQIENHSITICSYHIKDYEELLNNYFKKYDASIAYLDINNGYNYNYHENQVYYAASTIKTLSTIYLYDQALNNKEDLNKTLKYESKFIRHDSLAMQYHKVGEEISIKELINYSILVSDNTAYNMLINYIGKETLKDYAHNLGANYTLNLQDNYGSITTTDAIIYLAKLYELINANNPLSEELKNIFINSDENYLKINNYETLAKYGFYEQNFHLIGIVLTPHPYIVTILTLHGKDDYETIIKDINSKIYTLHNLYNQKSNCK